MNDVIWAMCTRVDPVNDTDFIRRAWSGPLDPIIPKDQKGFSSRAVIDATRPYEWMKDFPLASAASPELKKKIIEKYEKYFQKNLSKILMKQNAGFSLVLFSVGFNSAV